jgi:hypothetical protein
MREKLLKLLPWTALVGGVITVVFLIILTILHSGQLKENKENEQKVTKTLEKIQMLHPENIYDPSLKSEIEDALHSQYIATIWLISTEGEILFSKGNTANSMRPGSVIVQATVETHEILNSLPSESLTDHQRILLLAASAIQREGAHNDIYNHLIREIHSTNGSIVGLIGVAYELSSDPGHVATGWIVSVIFVLLGFPMYWLSLPLWVFLDARKYGKHAWLWAIYLSFGNLVALVAYILTRLPIDNSSIVK